MLGKLDVAEPELLELLRIGDESALAIIYGQYWEMMYLAAYNMTKNKEISEDIVQDVFVGLWKKRKNLKINKSIRSYLYTSTIFKVYDFFRKNKKAIREDLFDNLNQNIQSSTPESRLIHKELVEYIESIIEQLPPKSREVFKLSREELKSNKEIAEELGISQRTVEWHISKALKIIKSHMGVMVTLEFIVLLLQGNNGQ